jgi:benzoyl-CoA reductase/2-hydroxyglutaryl-CoA dehydratase subunit BcrC/BadD/HgdB
VKMAREHNADGVIHYALSFCQTYANEAIKVEGALKKAGIPVLTLESDFSASDAAQLTTRVQAFVEVLSR